MKKELCLELIICLIILMLFYACFSKWADMRLFRHVMLYQPFPAWAAETLVWLLPPIEMFTGILIIFPKTRRSGLFVFVLLMSAFSIYIIVILMHFFPDVPCSCGGLIQSMSWVQHLIFNIFFIVMGIISIRLEQQIKNSSSD